MSLLSCESKTHLLRSSEFSYFHNFLPVAAKDTVKAPKNAAALLCGQRCVQQRRFNVTVTQCLIIICTFLFIGGWPIT